MTTATTETKLQQIDDCLKLVSLDRLHELAVADSQKRAVILPCKPSGVTIYQVRKNGHAKGPGLSPRHVSHTAIYAGGNYALYHQGKDCCRKKDFGKTWFLSEEDYIASLKK